jgi:hypothetical protein
MSLISWLLRKIFGNGKVEKQAPVKQPSANDAQSTPAPEAQPTPAPGNDFMARWERQRNEKIKESEEKLKDWIILSIRERGSLAFSWESGSDEAFVTFRDNNEAEQDNFEHLEEYIVLKLDIPDAGEFRMDGSGTLYLADNQVKAKYSSIIKGITAYDEETDAVTYSEEEHDSGDKFLFMV